MTNKAHLYKSIQTFEAKSKSMGSKSIISVKIQGLLLIFLLVINNNCKYCLLANAKSSSYYPVWDGNDKCEVVNKYFPYCLDFLVGNYPHPDKKCCDHINKLNILAKRRLGPSYICQCIEFMVDRMWPPLLASRFKDLPIMCHTHLAFPISESMDCWTG